MPSAGGLATYEDRGPYFLSTGELPCGFPRRTPGFGDDGSVGEVPCRFPRRTPGFEVGGPLGVVPDGEPEPVVPFSTFV